MNDIKTFDILREEKKIAVLWLITFIVAFAVLVIYCIFGKER